MAAPGPGPREPDFLKCALLVSVAQFGFTWVGCPPRVCTLSVPQRDCAGLTTISTAALFVTVKMEKTKSSMPWAILRLLKSMSKI